MSPICLALANVYGPRQGRRGASGIFAGLGSAMISGSPFVLRRDVVDAHDFVFVDDVVDAFMGACSAPAKLTGTYNIGSGRPTTSTGVYRLISAVLDGTATPGGDDFDGEESCEVTLNSAKAHEDLGWRSCVGLEEGIRRTLRWLSDILEVDGPMLASV